MKLSDFSSGKSGRVKAITLSKQQQLRLLPIGIYKGAILTIQRQGNAHYPALLLVQGNLLMMRIKDLACIEMEE